MMPLTVKNCKSYHKQKGLFMYARKDSVLLMTNRNITKPKITVIIPENIEELLIVFAI